MIEWRDLEAMTSTFRTRIAETARSLADRAETIPPGWNNHVLWHVGHLACTPVLLTRGLAGDPLGLPEDRLALFRKGTGPRSWEGASPPSLETLLDEMVGIVPALFREFESRRDLRFATPYLTSAGVELGSPAEALTFSLVHDGIHLGLLLALRRALATEAGGAAAGPR